MYFQIPVFVEDENFKSLITNSLCYFLNIPEHFGYWNLLRRKCNCTAIKRVFVFKLNAQCVRFIDSCVKMKPNARVSSVRVERSAKDRFVSFLSLNIPVQLLPLPM